MAVVVVNQICLQKKSGLKEKEIIECLGSMGFPTESGEGNYLVEVTPDRPDMYFSEGIIRALNSYANGKKGKKYTEKESEYVITSDPSVKNVVPYISAFVAKEVNVSEEELKDLIEAQEKLHNTIGRKRKKCSMGIYNLEKIEFPLEYKIVNEYEFVPLDSNEKMGLGQILDEHPTGKEYAHLVERGKYPVIVEKNSGKVVAFPPILNSEETRLEKGTKNIFMEATGIHKEITEKVVSMFACAFADVGATIYNVKINREVHPRLEYSKWKLDVEEANKVLGTKFSKKEMETGLERMGYFIEKGNVLCPPYRVDMIDYIDVVEDIAIGIGYDKLTPTLPNFYTCGTVTKKTEEEEKIREIMNGFGFLEVVTPTLVDEGRLLDKNKALKIVNPCSEECTYMRDFLLSSMLAVLASNKMKGLPQKYYEIGVSYTGINERRTLSFMVMDKEVDLNEVRSYVQRFLKERKIKYKMEMKTEQLCEEGKAIGILSKEDNETLCGLGVIYEGFGRPKERNNVLGAQRMKCHSLVSRTKGGVPTWAEKGWFGKLNKKILGREGIEYEVVYGEIQL